MSDRAELAHVAIDVIGSFAKEKLGEDADPWIAGLAGLVHLGLDQALQAALSHKLEARTIAFIDET